MHNLQDVCSVELDNENESEYIGITFDKNNLKIIFPRGYSLSLNDKDLKKDIIILIKVFDKYIKRKKAKSYSREEKNLNKSNGKNFSISNAIWLLNDFESNGLYEEYIINYKVNKNGNINWSKTIKSIKPYISNNDLIYLDFIVKKNNNNNFNIITHIQRYIIKKCTSVIGWLYPNINIEGPTNLPYKKSICINLLKKELKQINIDKTKKLIINMINFLENDSDEKNLNKFKEYKTKYFMNIWEDMLNYILGNDEPNKYYPKAIWEIDNETISASNLRPDIILNSDKNTYVIDAKYYKYGITKSINHLPQSSDISKQLLYSKHIENNTKKNSYDAFILPYKSNNKKNLFEFVGNAKMDNNIYDNKKVVCILADMKSIMKKYIYGNELDKTKKDVIKIIDNQNK